MKRIITSRLPERLSGTLPPIVTELAVGVLAPLFFVAVRLALEPWTQDRAPFALSFAAVVVASLVAGWRSGLVALLLAQGLTWYLLIVPTNAGTDPEAVFALLLATFSQGVILLVLALYQREVAAARAHRERRIDFLGHALREIDHRTQNNFQTVMSLIQLQATRAPSADVKAALQEAADRVKAVSLVYEKLALSSEGLESVRLQDHLGELCEQIERGMLADGTSIETRFAPATVGAEHAICLGIITNELITNALKHAFDGGHGRIEVSTELRSNALVLRVADDGRGMTTEAGRKGLGTRLVDTFVRQLGARHEVNSSASGTEHRVVLPGFNPPPAAEL